MKKGFSLLEIIITTGLLAIFLLTLHGWLRQYNQNLNKLEKYYYDRNELLNKANRREGTEQIITENIYLRTITVNNLTLDYLVYK